MLDATEEYGEAVELHIVSMCDLLDEAVEDLGEEGGLSVLAALAGYAMEAHGMALCVDRNSMN